MPGQNAESIPRQAEADWLEAASMTTVMRGLKNSHMLAVGVWVVLALLTVGYAPLPVWAAVVVLTGVALVLRTRLLRGWRGLAGTGRIDAQLEFQRRYRWFWGGNAATLGLWPLVISGDMPSWARATSWMLLLGGGMMVSTWMSAHLGITRVFLRTLILTLIASSILQVVLRGELLASGLHFSALGMLLVYWGFMHRHVQRLHETHQASVDLGYQNERLIQSLREQTRAAQEAARFKDRFLASAAHDLKQPVNALSIYAEWLSAEPKLVDELAPRIAQAAQAVNGLFDSLFDLARLDAGRLDADLRPVDVRRLLRDLEVQYHPTALQKGLRLRVRAIDATLSSDVVMLRRIVGNLVANAIRYTPRGRVLLAARRRDGGISFEVWDTGIGIAGHEQQRVFGEFYKVPQGGTDEGFGLGLAIVQRLSDRLGYPVSMRSQPGRGSVFKVLAPASVTDSAGHSSARSAAPASGS